ncbi:hypothetical protein [Autumnicola psychrophila]|uniref:Uncharacterized protein n=1 Tax=Autumnicola psychrophila TaxID=3075592 RepID=A0ABU3DR19_9FLAO|nr:hypothetical protein [Zunongwangia sp. F225]MDT0686148.1 hypothetical protein [Zunongwangia sp. F225]
MKRINFLMLMFIFCVGSVLSVNAKITTEDPSAVKNEIEKLLKDHDLKLEEDVVTNVLLTLNDDKELVVLLIECENKDVRAYIKSRLNYRKIKSSMESKFENFVMPVRIKA